MFAWCLLSKSFADDRLESDDKLTWPSRVGGECSLVLRFAKILATLPDERSMSMLVVLFSCESSFAAMVVDILSACVIDCSSKLTI